MKTVLVKIQVPIFGTDGPALVYNKGRALHKFVPIDDEIKKAMGNDPKKFFEIEDLGPEKIRIVKEAPWQIW